MIITNSAGCKRKILVIDDEVIIQDYLKEVLEHYGYDVVCCGDYEKAVSLFNINKIDLILSDICLPGGYDGIDILKKAKQINPDVPVVMITGIPNVETASNALRHGAFEYITKPLKTIGLMDIVDKAIKSRIVIEEKRKKEYETEEYKNKLKKEIEQKTDQLKITQDNYSRLIENAPEMICIIDEKLRFVQVNSTMIALLGYTSEEIAKMKINSLVPPKQHKKIKKHFSDIFASNSAEVIECNFIKKNGELLDAEIHSTFHRMADNNDVKLASSYVRDITAHNLLMTKLIETEKQATLGQFASCIGHEMNNLVTSLIGYIELVKETPDDVDLIKKIIDIFDTQTQRIHVLSENLLTLGAKRIEKSEKICIQRAVEQTIELLKPSIKVRSCVFVKEFERDLPKITGDELKFQQLLTNLIINAADSMENKGVVVIRLKTADKKKNLILEIEDHGCGISKDNLKRIFNGFFTTKPIGKGTGLGMLVVKEIVERYSGTIDIYSKINEGTTVIIKFPVK